MVTEIINVVSDVAALVAVLSVVVFIGTYTKLAPWWRDSIGLTLVLAEFFVLALFVSIFLHIVLIPAFSDVPIWVSIVDLFITTGIICVNFWRTVVMVRLARR